MTTRTLTFRCSNLFCTGTTIFVDLAQNPRTSQTRIRSRQLLLFLTPVPSPAWAWGLKTLKAEGQIFLQNKRCSTGCKLTRAASGTSASFNNKKRAFTCIMAIYDKKDSVKICKTSITRVCKCKHWKNEKPR